ncbi:Cyclophilin-type peptidyl-prolyl cis-trans isomerase [Moritella viscosa]|uniref:Peptidyl-prolyl cis-trans isomerase n=2 Tax=Moritella viscosa TaxID=80854 RepID=A0A1K9YUA6_9GAMM|nr:Cyclophilin-type peptidyl-prolyl cis-trans isomerase [Moritella viscosa]SGY83206.1 Cyclophilin-type peptidyl-prolyl cis-trans isomerase [Moritella viscosa]SGY83629.1 Cyclophilin-type peptidyl-prolyl cis-trans isomerase [Moritella viscosa]SHN97143.1 Cyclophilin-type peptidyl-prolyl cis-trans isomerase [Moritella viscosa]SHN97144.1 Cyclophilin-type peptidyl-prolyl cis-trans isomerase [Moritella viscosa]
MRINHFFAKLLLILSSTFMFNTAIAAETKALIKTNLGEITIELYPEQAPVSVANFISYVENDFYSGIIFHRVIPGFMAQTGGFNENLEKQTTKAPIINEANNGLSNERGTLSLARTNNPNSATSQFFINLKDNNFLNRSGSSASQAGYAVFGRVIKGMDVVDKMAKQPTGKKKHYSDVPLTNIVIESITMLK